MSNTYEQAIQSFVLGQWSICERNHWSGLMPDRDKTIIALIDLRDNGVESVGDPHATYGYRFAGTDHDAERYRYEESTVVSGSGTSYVFADESEGEMGLGTMIRTVLEHADKAVSKVLNDRISRAQNPQNKYWV